MTARRYTSTPHPDPRHDARLLVRYWRYCLSAMFLAMWRSVRHAPRRLRRWWREFVFAREASVAVWIVAACLVASAVGVLSHLAAFAWVWGGWAQW